MPFSIQELLERNRQELLVEEANGLLRLARFKEQL